jgi:hypothetical protein
MTRISSISIVTLRIRSEGVAAIQKARSASCISEKPCATPPVHVFRRSFARRDCIAWNSNTAGGANTFPGLAARAFHPMPKRGSSG